MYPRTIIDSLSAVPNRDQLTHKDLHAHFSTGQSILLSGSGRDKKYGYVDFGMDKTKWAASIHNTYSPYMYVQIRGGGRHRHRHLESSAPGAPYRCSSVRFLPYPAKSPPHRLSALNQ